MKVNGHTLTVLREDGTPFPEVEGESGHFVVADPGQVFQVCVQLSSEPGLYSVCLKVAGNCVGYTYRGKRPGGCCTFDGFRDTSGAAGETVREFCFAQPAEAPASEKCTVEQLQASKVSQLEVKVHSTQQLGDKPGKTAPGGSYKPPAPDTIPQRLEGKKGFVAPSLAVQASAATTKKLKWSTKRHKDNPVPLAVLTVRCETVSHLALRRVLSHANPAHVAIMAASTSPQNTAHSANPPPSSKPAALPRVAQLRQDAVQRQPLRAVTKRERERGSNNSVPRAGTVEVVDLTEQHQRPREKLSCDLLASGGPRWAKRPNTPAVKLSTSAPGRS